MKCGDLIKTFLVADLEKKTLGTIGKCNLIIGEAAIMLEITGQQPMDDLIYTYEASGKTEDDKDNIFIDNTLTAMELCRNDADGRSGVSGTIKCPACGSKLNYSVSSFNGHLWGTCETAECLRWME